MQYVCGLRVWATRATIVSEDKVFAVRINYYASLGHVTKIVVISHYPDGSGGVKRVKRVNRTIAGMLPKVGQP